MPINRRERCTKCGGGGVEEEVVHQDENGNIEIEPIKCSNCDGFGSIMKVSQNIISHKHCRGGGGNNFHCGCKYNG